LQLEDTSGGLEVTVFNRLYEECQDKLSGNPILIVQGKVEEDSFTGGVRVIAESLKGLNTYRQHAVKQLCLTLGDESHLDQLLSELPVITAHARPGYCPILIRYASDKASADIQLGTDWNVTLSDELLRALANLCGHEHVEVLY